SDSPVRHAAAQAMDHHPVPLRFQFRQQPNMALAQLQLLGRRRCVIFLSFAFFNATNRSRSVWLISSCPWFSNSQGSTTSIEHFYFALLGHSHFAATSVAPALTSRLPLTRVTTAPRERLKHAQIDLSAARPSIGREHRS